MSWNWISVILAILVGVLTLLQICWDYVLTYIFKDGRTNEHKLLRRGLLILTLVLFILNQLVGLINSYNKDQQAKTDKRDLTNQLATITDENSKLREVINQGFRDISREFSTNATIPAAIRLAVLDDAQKKLLEERVELQKSHEVSSANEVDLKTLRAEREKELALQDNQKKQDAIQKEIEDIQKQKDAEEATKRREQAARNQQWADEELVKSKRLLAGQILPMFDYTIQELDKLIAAAAKEAGQKRFSDFPGDTPTIYASALVKEGLIVNGTNTICVGTNLMWNFRITTSVVTLHAFPNFPPSSWPDHADIRPGINIQFQEPYVSISIASAATNSESKLTISPYRNWNFDMGAEPAPMSDRPFYSQISIKLNVPNGLNIDEVQPSENFRTAIDKALKRFVGALDQQFPLNLNTNQ